MRSSRSFSFSSSSSSNCMDVRFVQKQEEVFFEKILRLLAERERGFFFFLKEEAYYFFISAGNVLTKERKIKTSVSKRENFICLSIFSCLLRCLQPDSSCLVHLSMCLFFLFLFTFTSSWLFSFFISSRFFLSLLLCFFLFF